MEKEYMDYRGYSYRDTGKLPTKGCVARLLALIKSKAIKILNKKSERSHKGTPITFASLLVEASHGSEGPMRPCHVESNIMRDAFRLVSPFIPALLETNVLSV
jgi:hypothetical protein